MYYDHIWFDIFQNRTTNDTLQTKQSLNYKLQLIQNAAARVLTDTRKVDHITPVLRSLHWLPVDQRIDFKILLLVFKSLDRKKIGRAHV